MALVMAVQAVVTAVKKTRRNFKIYFFFDLAQHIMVADMHILKPITVLESLKITFSFVKYSSYIKKCRRKDSFFFVRIEVFFIKLVRFDFIALNGGDRIDK